jgi:hypothetical protein
MIYQPKPPLTRNMQREWYALIEVYSDIRARKHRVYELTLRGYPDFPLPMNTFEADMIKLAAQPFFDAVQNAKREYEQSEKELATIFKWGQFNGLSPFGH